MIRTTLICALLVLSAPATAASFASSAAGAGTAGSSASSRGSSASSNSTSGSSKVVQQARDDAASFVASEGRIRGVRLEAALVHLREHHADARKASDMELAQAILAL